MYCSFVGCLGQTVSQVTIVGSHQLFGADYDTSHHSWCTNEEIGDYNMLRLFTSPALIVSSTEPIVTRSVTDKEQPLLRNGHLGLDVLSSVTAPSAGSPGNVLSLITPPSCVPSDDVPSAKCLMFRPAPKIYPTRSHVAS